MIVKDRLRISATACLYARRVGRKEWTLVRTGHNVALAVGKNQVALLLTGDAANVWRRTALGSDGTAASSTDTSLGAEVIRKLWSGYKTSANVITAKTYFAPHEANATLREWGIVDTATGGVFLNRGNISPAYTKADTEELMMEVVITVG